MVTPRTKPYGLEDSAELFTADALVVGGGAGDEAILMKIARGSHDAFEWLESMNVRFGAPYVAHSACTAGASRCRETARGGATFWSLRTTPGASGFPCG